MTSTENRDGVLRGIFNLPGGRRFINLALRMHYELEMDADIAIKAAGEECGLDEETLKYNICRLVLASIKDNPIPT